MHVFFDSSAWAKRYVEEKGSDKVIEISDTADNVTLSILCIPELISAFSRLQRENKISKTQFTQLKIALINEIEDVQLVNISETVVNQSVILLQKHILRTLDALHLSCALAVEIDLFVTADQRQYAAAEALGLTTQLI